MLQVEHSFLKEKLQKDGLFGLCDVLRTNGAYLAGSYIIRDMKHVPEFMPDIDIWIPFSKEKEAQRLQISNITAFLYLHGYGMPRISFCSKKRAHTKSHTSYNAYRRIHHLMDQIICFKSDSRESRIPIQILVMNRNGGNTANDIVKHFDLTLVQQYYDGSKLWASKAAIHANTTKLLGINLESDVIRHQTFPEWTRTLSRIVKYNLRGYSVDDTTSDILLAYGTTSLKECAKVQSEFCFALGDRVYTINVESYIEQWNTMSRRIGWCNSVGPVISITVRQHGTSLQQVDLCILCTHMTGPVTESYVQCRNGNLIGLTIEPHKRACRIIRWNDAMHHISTLVPFPNINCLQHVGIKFVPDVNQVVHDHVAVEDTTVEKYILDDIGNNFIIYIYGNPNTLSRTQIRMSKVYLPCVKKQSADRKNVNMDHSAVIGILIPSGNFYIPCSQLQQVLDVPGSFRFRVVPSKIIWDCSSLLIGSDSDRRDTFSYVGGIANDGGPDSAKSIHFIERLP